MDRKTWLAVGLSILGIVLWQWYYSATYGPYLKQQEEARRKQQEEAVAATSAATPDAAPQATPAPAAPAPTPAPAIPARTESLTIEGKNASAKFEFNNDAGGIASAILLMHLGEDREAITLNKNPQVPIGALATDPATPLGGFQMEIDRENSQAIFTKTEGDGLQIEKRFILPKPDSKEAPYALQLEVTFKNPTTYPISRPAYYVSTGSMAPVHQNDLPTYTRFDWERDSKMTGIDVNWFNAGTIPLTGIEIRGARPIYAETASNVEWAAVASQYFCTVVACEGGQSGTAVWARRFPVEGAKSSRPVYGVQGALGLPGFTIEPGGTVTQKFEIYAGPKELSRLAALGHGEDAILNFGWFGFVSKFLLWAMNGLYGLVGSYAAAIILLTLLIKTALWPIQNKATNSMRRMSLLSPKMAELREKYKDDPTKMNEELMKLYKDYGINPFSGCLPMLIQIPIFFGFYAMLGSAIQLRNSEFLWIHDLSQPDTVAHILGFPLNVLPLLMAGTMVWQMAITPKTGDPSQQRIMMLMPVIFVVFAYNYASALSLYWTTQNLFSIVQLYLTRNRPLPKLEKVQRAVEPGKKRRKRATP